MTVSNTIESYRKKRKQPRRLYLVLGVAAILVVIGIIVVLFSVKGSPLARAFASKTPTFTVTFTPSLTNTPTETPTITPTETITETPTRSGYSRYTVQEGDTLTSIIKDQNLGENGLILIYMLNPPGAGTGIDPMHPENMQVGQVITLPYPGQAIPTATALPTGLANGSKISYRVLPGDSLGYIASKFNSTPEAIVAANRTLLTEGITSMIYPGWLLQVPINIVTPIPTRVPTATLTPLGTP
jgi:LysM repeat protein